MEQMMYYGWLLEYTYEGDTEKQDYYTLGQDAEQLVKYVYRGADTTDSDSTKASMEQIQHTIAAMRRAQRNKPHSNRHPPIPQKKTAERFMSPKQAKNTTTPILAAKAPIIPAVWQRHSPAG